jgi:hypothetical protein
MSSINWSRVALGGLLWNVVYGALVAVEVPQLAHLWQEELGQAFRPPSGTGLAVVGGINLLLGFFAIWLYAAIRPHYGPGPRSACIAGVAVWYAGLAPLLLFNAVAGWFSLRFMAIDAALNLVEVILATLAGAWLYKTQVRAPDVLSEARHEA